MPRKKPITRKRRTREHVIADLSANHVERHALLCGFSVQRVLHDYGIDLVITTFNRRGERENGQIQVQLKATDHAKAVSAGQSFAVRVEREDLHHWLREPMPVILVLYDAAGDAAYWLYVQAHFANQPGFDVTRAGAQVTIRIPRTNVVNQAAMKKFTEFRERAVAQTKGVTHRG